MRVIEKEVREKRTLSSYLGWVPAVWGLVVSALKNDERACERIEECSYKASRGHLNVLRLLTLLGVFDVFEPEKCFAFP